MSCPTPKNKADKIAALVLRDYQVEVVNKCTGRLALTDHPDAGLYYLFGLHVPEHIVMAALGVMQDARLRNRDSEQPTINNLSAYYTATVRSMCADAGVETPINWREDD